MTNSCEKRKRKKGRLTRLCYFHGIILVRVGLSEILGSYFESSRIPIIILLFCFNLV